MARQNITVDKTELVLIVPVKNSFKVMNLNYSQITRIQFDKFIESSLFKKVPSEKISIITSKSVEPIVFKQSKEKQYFDTYKSQLALFAKNNRITFADNTKNTQA